MDQTNSKKVTKYKYYLKGIYDLKFAWYMYHRALHYAEFCTGWDHWVLKHPGPRLECSIKTPIINYVDGVNGKWTKPQC